MALTQDSDIRGMTSPEELITQPCDVLSKGERTSISSSTTMTKIYHFSCSFICKADSLPRICSGWSREASSILFYFRGRTEGILFILQSLIIITFCAFAQFNNNFNDLIFTK